jgi:hypothetical protein
MTAKFETGVLVATPGALAVLRASGQSPVDFINRHINGDWGDVDGHDFKANQIALREGGRLMSAYTTRKGEALWIVTEADRSSTCILLPGEY